MNNTLNLAIKKTAREFSVDPKLIENIYKSYWLFIKKRISNLSLEDMNQETFDSTTSNFNLPFIGKLYVNYDKIEKYRRQLKYFKNVRTKND